MSFLDAIPRLEIGRWPTPVSRLHAVSDAVGAETWVKLEESCGAWAGNKVRKLEYLLAEARTRGASTLVAYGAASSSWAPAVAVHGTTAGFRVNLGVAGRARPQYERLYSRPHVRVTWASRLELLPAAAIGARLSARAMRPAVLPAGGSGGVGDVGSARAGLEIAEAVTRHDMPRPELVFVAAGSGGTAAGLAVGLGIGGLHVPVVAVRAAPRPWGTARLVRRRARALMTRASALDAGARGALPAPVVSDERFFAPGYGVPGAAALEAQELAARDGITLDETYAAKAFAALVASARAGAIGPLLYVHTSPGPPPRPQ